MTHRPMMGALLLTCIAGSAAHAQRVAVEAVSSVDAWKTDPGSLLLAQNAGDPALTGQAYLWVAWQPVPRLRIMALGRGYSELEHAGETGADLETMSVRWWGSRAFRVEAGKVLMPIGEFGMRRYANVNPLIGEPDTYGDAYPWGASVTGARGRVDYQAGMVTQPAVNLRYTPVPGSRLRPVLGAGLTLSPSLHVGLGWTHGPYLSGDLSAELPAGSDWQRYQQSVATFDVHFSRGRLDTHAEAAWSSYQVPTVADPVRGLGWYADARITLSPRLFLAARLEHNRYAFVRSFGPGQWVGAATTQMNGEAGLGYHLSRDAMIKATIRKDHWPVHQVGTTAFPDGYALATQVSLDTDLLAALTRKP
jgi:hypothetical protein